MTLAVGFREGLGRAAGNAGLLGFSATLVARRWITRSAGLVTDLDVAVNEQSELTVGLADTAVRSATVWCCIDAVVRPSVEPD